MLRTLFTRRPATPAPRPTRYLLVDDNDTVLEEFWSIREQPTSDGPGLHVTGAMPADRSPASGVRR